VQDAGAVVFPKVARIMRPRRRRQVSPQERERLRAMGFRKGAQAHVEDQYSGHTGVSEGRGDPESLPCKTAAPSEPLCGKEAG